MQSSRSGNVSTQNGYEHAGNAELEVYLSGDPNSEDYKSEVWIPIFKEVKYNQ